MLLRSARRPPPPHVFISYRENDSGGHARHLCTALSLHWGKAHVHTADKDIPVGRDYIRASLEMIASSDVTLVLIGPRWVDEKNRERLANPDDLLRREVETALQQGKHVVPVLLDGASMPNPETLPPTLVSLRTLNAFEFNVKRWDTNVQELAREVERLHSPKGRAADDSRLSGSAARGYRWALVILVAILAAGIGAWILRDRLFRGGQNGVTGPAPSGVVSSTQRSSSPAREQAARQGPGPPQRATADTAPPSAPGGITVAASTEGPSSDSAGGWTTGPREMRRVIRNTTAVLRKIELEQEFYFDRVTLDFGETEPPGWRIEFLESPPRRCRTGERAFIDGKVWLRVRLENAQFRDHEDFNLIPASSSLAAPNVVQGMEVTCDLRESFELMIGINEPTHFRVRRETGRNARLIVEVGYNPR